MTNEGQITLLICDDHKILTDALAMVVAVDDALTMVAPPVHDAESAVEICGEHLPQVVLMDIVFKGGMSGIEATRRIKEVSPSTKVVIIFMFLIAAMLFSFDIIFGYLFYFMHVLKTPPF